MMKRGKTTKMFPGFTKRHKGTISNGDWDRDGVVNRKDCEPLNFRKQDTESNWRTAVEEQFWSEHPDEAFEAEMRSRERGKEIDDVLRKARERDK